MTGSDRPQRVLVTGGAGFIGSHVVDRYVLEGCEVTVVDDLSTGRRHNLSSDVDLIVADVADPALDAVFAEKRFDVVNHHAAQMDVRVSVADPLRDARCNVIGLLNILESCARHGVDRVIYVSSGGVVYGEPDQVPTPESHKLEPLSPYGVTKLTGEQYLFYYAQVRGLNYAALRYSNVYGPRQQSHGEAGVVAIFSDRILRGDEITIFGDGRQERDYVHVDDVVEANWLASIVSLPEVTSLHSRAWNIGSGRGTSVNELADRLISLVGREVSRVIAPERDGELYRSVLEIGKAEGELGWRPRVSLRAGLEGTVRHIANQLEIHGRTEMS